MIAGHEQADAARLLLSTIRDGRGLVELRALRPGKPVIRRWYDDPRRAVEHARGAGDVYVGAIARTSRGSGRSALLDVGRHVWADLDTASAVAALRAFRPRPTFVVESGGLDGDVPRLQAWWLLVQHLALGAVEHLNRRLALALGADPASVDAARVLRMPGTVNSKTGRTARVIYVGDDVSAYELTAALPFLESPLNDPRLRTSATLPVAATEYVPLLAGVEVGRDGKAHCPLHDDSTPSLHAYADPARGWFCYGCREGGDAYTLAGLLWGLNPRDDFPELQRRVLAALEVPA